MKTKILTIILFIITGSIQSQSRYDDVSVSRYTPSSNSELSSLPLMLKQKYDENLKYINSLKSWILELKPQIEEKSFIERLDIQYNYLARFEGQDLARLTEAIQDRELDIKKIISDYNIFIKNQNEKNIQNNQNTQNNNVSFFTMGFNSFKNKEFAKSITEFSKHLENDKTNTDALFFRALAKSELNDKYGAINDYEKIIELNSNYPMRYGKLSTIYNNKAYCLVGLKKYQEALPFVEKALELDKSEYYIWDTRGEIYYNLGKFDKCISDMSKAISIEEHDNSFYFRGLSLIKLGKKESGCKDLSKSGELGNEDAYVQISKKCK